MLNPQILELPEKYAAGYLFATKVDSFNPKTCAAYWTNCKFTAIPADVYSAFATGSPGEIGLFKAEKNKGGTLDYFYGSLLDNLDNLPEEAEKLTIPGGLYGVFETEKLNMAQEGTTAFVLDVYALWLEIYEEYLPQSNFVIDTRRPGYEFYGTNSAVNSDMSMNIFIPLKKKSI